MGFFRRIQDGLNEEFVIGRDNVRRYEEDPDSRDRILAGQHARGIGSARGLREYARAQADHGQAPQREGWPGRIGQLAMIAGLGALAAHLWNERGED